MVTTPCYDANGNITDYVETNGTVVAHREFDAFGNTVVATGSMVHTLHYWFSTKYLDEETGLYYYGFRYYSPGLGRWVNRDLINEGDDGAEVSLYAYIENQSVNVSDDLGLKSTKKGAKPTKKKLPPLNKYEKLLVSILAKTKGAGKYTPSKSTVNCLGYALCSKVSLGGTWDDAQEILEAKCRSPKRGEICECDEKMVLYFPLLDPIDGQIVDYHVIAESESGSGWEGKIGEGFGIVTAIVRPEPSVKAVYYDWLEAIKKGEGKKVGQSSRYCCKKCR